MDVVNIIHRLFVMFPDLNHFLDFHVKLNGLRTNTNSLFFDDFFKPVDDFQLLLDVKDLCIKVIDPHIEVTILATQM